MKSRINYNSETGVMKWSMGAGNRHIGKECGWIATKSNGKKYRYISIDGKNRLAHRIAWEIYYGYKVSEIDHINGDSLDNRICNLRSVTHKDNQKNQKLRSDNKTGIMGVKISKSGKYVVTISSRYCGIFIDFFEACCKRKSLELHEGFHNNHGSINK